MCRKNFKHTRLIKEHVKQQKNTKKYENSPLKNCREVYT